MSEWFIEHAWDRSALDYNRNRPQNVEVMRPHDVAKRRDSRCKLALGADARDLKAWDAVPCRLPGRDRHWRVAGDLMNVIP
jgi:hypothetical protein